MGRLLAGVVLLAYVYPGDRAYVPDNPCLELLDRANAKAGHAAAEARSDLLLC